MRMSAVLACLPTKRNFSDLFIEVDGEMDRDVVPAVSLAPVVGRKALPGIESCCSSALMFAQFSGGSLYIVA